MRKRIVEDKKYGKRKTRKGNSRRVKTLEKLYKEKKQYEKRASRDEKT